jgi:hypothetical protein
MKSPASAARRPIRLTAVVLGTALGFAVGFSKAAESSQYATQPVDLTGKYLYPLSTLTNANYFAAYAWKTVPTGYQVVRNVPFEIGGQIRLWGEGRNDGYATSFPKEIPDIAVNRKFEAIYVYHGSGFKSPDGTPVWNLVLRYADGTSATNTLRFGADVLDWMVGGNEEPLRTPYATNSMIAWVGGRYSEKQNNRLRFCLTAFNNPHPDRLVATIDLISCNSKTAASILAITTGPANLPKAPGAGAGQ